MAPRAGWRRRRRLRLRPGGWAVRWLLQGHLALVGTGRSTVEPCPPDGRMHQHAAHRLVCVLSGRGWLQAPEERLAVRAGDVLVLRPGERHALSPGPRRGLQLCTVEFVAAAVLSGPERAMLEAVSASGPVIHCTGAAAREAQRLVHLVRAEQRRHRDAGVLAIRAYLVSLLVLLYRRCPRLEVRIGPPVEPALARVRQRMETHFAEPCRVPELAELAHLSTRQFTARFKRAFGVTPLQYLTRLRVAAAQDLLRRSDQGVAAIAREVGYENLSHFYRTFAHYTGMSPGRFRLSQPQTGAQGGNGDPDRP